MWPIQRLYESIGGGTGAARKARKVCDSANVALASETHAFTVPRRYPIGLIKIFELQSAFGRIVCSNYRYANYS